MDFNKNYWNDRYTNQQTGWDIGFVSTPLKTYFDQLSDKNLKILIPGAGNGYEVEYLFQLGFQNVYVIDLAETPLKNIKQRVPNFPSSQLIQGNFFEFVGHQFDLIIEQTFFSAIPPSKRADYAKQMKSLLKNEGKLVGVLFDDPLFEDHPPFGGNKDIYLPFFKNLFEIIYFERCYNSIPPRKNRELFFMLKNHLD